MGGEDADRADLRRARDVDPVRGAGDRVSGRERRLAGDGPERLARALAERADPVDEVEEPADHAAGRIQLQHDRPDGLVGERRLQRPAERAVVGGAEQRRQPVAAGQQRTEHRDDGNAVRRDRVAGRLRIVVQHGREGTAGLGIEREQPLERAGAKRHRPAGQPGDDRK